MALETPLQAILRTMRERSTASSQWEYSQVHPRYMVTATSGDHAVAFVGSSLSDIAWVYLIETVSRTAAATIQTFGSDLVVVLDRAQGEKFAAKTTVTGSDRGPFTVRIHVDGAAAVNVATAIACAKQSVDIGLYGGPDTLAFQSTFTVDGALLAFASFFVGCERAAIDSEG